MRKTPFSLKAFFVILLFAAVSFYGCEDDSGSNSTPGTTSPPSLTGTWQNNCIYDAVDDESSYEVFTVTESGFQVVKYSYNGSGCTAVDLTKTWTTTGSYSIGEATTTATTQETVFPADITILSMSMTPKDQAFVDWANPNSFCGIDTWALDVPTDLTGATCGTDQLPSNGTMMYDIISVENGTTLYFGDDSGTLDGTSESNRPEDLDKTNPYTKQ